MKKLKALGVADLSPTDSIVMLMGSTGAGKSTFIDMATGQGGETIGHSLYSETSQVRAVRVHHPITGRPVVFVDTPPLNHTHILAGEVLQMILIWLKEMYRKNIKLAGIVYLYRITDNMMRPYEFYIFSRLFCEDAMHNVIIATTMWSGVRKATGERRETMLREELWMGASRRGAQITRFEHTLQSAWAIVDIIMSGPGPATTFLQKALAFSKVNLNDPRVCAHIYTALERNRLLVDLEQLQEEAERMEMDHRGSPPLAKRIPSMLSFVKFPLMSKYITGRRPSQPGAEAPPLDNPSQTGLENGIEAGTEAGELTDIITRLEGIFEDVEQYRDFLNRKRSEPQSQTLLDLFQQLLEEPSLEAQFRRNLVIATQRLSKVTSLYPKCFTLEDLGLASADYVASGGSADVFKSHINDKAICLKVIRLHSASEVDYAIKRFYKEAILWGQLSHPNLLPFHGLYYYQNRVCLVSPWVKNGHIREYLSRNPLVNRVLLALDTIKGVSYLHANDIVHGDLKGDNTLVDDLGRARLADFGISAVTDRKILQWTSQSSPASRGGTIRWQAPEISGIENDEFVPNSKAGDLYAWAGVVYEIFTGLLPFFEILNEYTVMFKVNTGLRPSRPSADSPAWVEWGLTEAIWSLMQACWVHNPLDRPSAEAVEVRLSDRLSITDTRPNGSWGELLSVQSQAVGKYPSGAELEELLRGLDDQLPIQGVNLCSC